MNTKLNDFRMEIKRVCEKCGRNPESVTLIAVSKKQPLSKIQEAYENKQFDFGENYVQEALEKQKAFSPAQIKWHLIGPVQKNKINKILGKFSLIHSIDSIDLAEEINKRAEKNNLKVNVLLQINLANEATKSGQSKNDLLKNFDRYLSFKNLQIDGLMTMPPLESQPEKSRPYFKELFELAKQLNLNHLSMGTSSDWKVAIEEGATFIRIGTAVFGERGL